MSQRRARVFLTLRRGIFGTTSIIPREAARLIAARTLLAVRLACAAPLPDSAAIMSVPVISDNGRDG